MKETDDWEDCHTLDSCDCGRPNIIHTKRRTRIENGEPPNLLRCSWFCDDCGVILDYFTDEEDFYKYDWNGKIIGP